MKYSKYFFKHRICYVVDIKNGRVTYLQETKKKNKLQYILCYITERTFKYYWSKKSYNHKMTICDINKCINIFTEKYKEQTYSGKKLQKLLIKEKINGLT